MASTLKTLMGINGKTVLALGLGALMTISAPVSVAAAPLGGDREVRAEVADRAGDLRRFYSARDNRPLWISASGAMSPAVDHLLRRLETAQFDALDERTLKRLRTKSLRRDLDRALAGDPEDIARADVALSQMFAAYVRAMRAGPRGEMLYESEALAPAVPTPEAALAAAAAAPSLDRYIDEMGWMHPFYAPLRDAMDSREFSPDRRRVIWENIDRVRALPATPPKRYVLVDAASARLWMYEDGKPVDTMRVVVGKPETQTPVMAGFIRHAIVNPYWNVPPDLVQKTIARNVLSSGIRYLKANGYEVLSDYSPGATVVDPAKVDWKAVSQGATPPYVRQKPGGGNFMGKVKYEFPNELGIYLHDTPERALLKRADRQLSNGCVRLEDADRLGRWLLNGQSVAKMPAKGERKIDLPTLVPVYITYLTALPEGNRIAFRGDVYGHDSAPRMASAGGAPRAN